MNNFDCVSEVNGKCKDHFNKMCKGWMKCIFIKDDNPCQKCFYEKREKTKSPCDSCKFSKR